MHFRVVYQVDLQVWIEELCQTTTTNYCCDVSHVLGFMQKRSLLQEQVQLDIGANTSIVQQVLLQVDTLGWSSWGKISCTCNRLILDQWILRDQ